MVSVRFTRLARSESATSVTAGLLDLDEVAACSHLTTPIMALPVRSRQQVPRGDDWPGRVSTPVEVNFCLVQLNIARDAPRLLGFAI